MPEVKRDEITQDTYTEWFSLIMDLECAECGSELTIRTIPERESLALTCARDKEHTGFRRKTVATEEYRQGMPVHPAIQQSIESKMMEKQDFNRAINILARRYPKAIQDPAGASLFIRDCIRLGLDPLIQPAEAVPIAFKVKDKDNKQLYSVAMVVTEDGYLSMAARGVPEEYDGAPATMTLIDYLMHAHPDRTFEDLEKVRARTAEELSGANDSYVWVAMGKRRSATTINPVYGWYTKAERAAAQSSGLPAGDNPGNQARVRAVKRWVRENFPEARQRMIEYTEDLYRRSASVEQAQEFIDAEYSILISPLNEKDRKQIAPADAKQNEKRGELERNKSGESAKRSRSGKSKGGGDKKPPTKPSGAEETDLFHEQGAQTSEKKSGSSAAEPSLTEEELLARIAEAKGYMDHKTARSFLQNVGKYTIDQIMNNPGAIWEEIKDKL
jgi:hypothetical protein